MSELTFREPSVLWVAIPLCVVALAVAMAAPPHVSRVQPRRLDARAAPHGQLAVRRLPAMAVASGFGLLVVALMDPVVPYSETQVTARGLDIVLVVDLSSSMQEIMGLPRPTQSMANLTFSSRDNTPRRLTGKTRLDTTKEALKDLISRRDGDRLGLIVFSDHAYLVSPLTFDHDNLYKYVDMIDDQILRGEGMTAIGDGVTMATQLLARQSAGEGDHKLIVVFTDGENNTGRDPLSALAEADARGHPHPRDRHRPRRRGQEETRGASVDHDGPQVRRPVFQRRYRSASCGRRTGGSMRWRKGG